MKFVKGWSVLLVASAVLLSAPAFAHVAAVAVYCLTDKGHILINCNANGLEHTDAEIRFIHAARNTLIKVRNNGAIYANGLTGYSGLLAQSTGWKSLGTDANINHRNKLAGGDNLVFPSWYGGVSDGNSGVETNYTATLRKHSGSTIYEWISHRKAGDASYGGEWIGGEWKAIDSGVYSPGYIRGGFKSEERSPGVFQMMHIGTDKVRQVEESEEVLFHSNRFPWDYRAYYKKVYEDSFSLIAGADVDANGVVKGGYLMERIYRDGASFPFTIRNIAASGNHLWVNWRHTPSGTHELWHHDPRAHMSMYRVLNEAILDMAAEYDSDGGDTLYVLMGDRKTVKRVSYGGAVSTIPTSFPAGASTFKQIIVVTHKGGEESDTQ